MKPEGSLPHSQQPAIITYVVPQDHFGSDAFVTVATCLNLYSEQLLAPRPTPKLEDHPFSAVRDGLFNIFAATLHIWKSFLHPQPQDAPCHDDMAAVIAKSHTIKKNPPHTENPSKFFCIRHAVNFPPTESEDLSIITGDYSARQQPVQEIIILY